MIENNNYRNNKKVPITKKRALLIRKQQKKKGNVAIKTKLNSNSEIKNNSDQRSKLTIIIVQFASISKI